MKKLTTSTTFPDLMINERYYNTVKVVADKVGFSLEVTHSEIRTSRALVTQWSWDKWDWCNVPVDGVELAHMVKLVTDLFMEENIRSLQLL